MNLSPEEDQQMGKVQKEKDDPSIEGAKSFREAREKPSFFKA